MGENKVTDTTSMAVAEIANSKTIAVIVKPNRGKNEIVGYSSRKKAWVISVKVPAEKDKANKELLKFLKKTTGKAFAIKSGSRSKEKILVTASS